MVLQRFKGFDIAESPERWAVMKEPDPRVLTDQFNIMLKLT